MSRPYILRKNVSRISDLQGGHAALGLGIGNVYWVIKTTETHYAQFLEDHLFEYSDGSASVQTSIQAALDATVECRNDYVMVMPSDSDYDLTAALTLSKKGVHLIAAGSSPYYPNGCGNSVRLDQTGAYPVMVVSDSAIEIAGFYLKNYYCKGGIIIANTSYGLNIHHNYWAMRLNTATNEPMLGPYISNASGDAGAWSTFHSNFIQSQAGASATIAAIIRFNSQATGVRVLNTDIAIGDTDNTATVGILNLSVKGQVNDCNFSAHQTASGAGVFTHCIQIHASGTAYGNRGNVADGELVVGGTDDLSYVLNYNSVDGGTQDEQH